MNKLLCSVLILMFVLAGCEASLSTGFEDRTGTANIIMDFKSNAKSAEGGPMAAIRSQDIAYVELTVMPADVKKVLCGSNDGVNDGDVDLETGSCSFEGQQDRSNRTDGDDEIEDPDFENLVVLPEGQQTFTILAYDTGNNPVGAGSTQATVIANDTIIVYIEIKDSTGSENGPKHRPIITGMTISKTNPVVGELISLSVTAYDSDNDTLSYQWTDNCLEGSFTNPTSSSTQWSSSKEDACDLTITVSDSSLNTSASKGVVVFSNAGGSGGVTVQGKLVSNPFIYEVELEKTGDDCRKVSPNSSSYYGSKYWYRRDTLDATCSEPFPVGGSYKFRAYAYVESGQIGHSWTYTSSCGGSFINPSFYPDPENGGSYYYAYWQAPSTPKGCTLTAKIDNDGLIDEFSISLLLVD